ncbi:PaaI family thioesterase [Lutispora thermophila]|uniref:Acyl-CoA thioesterase n=1 Tax=Lutispora thermophila DSM 19022 TaxID=1122184 RepID=A0A1M6JB57_9FIRM|nr:PaaI family thioesterase [Lutispora thermophila]SHJ43920.1 acyl-CoA thioesterase [Lutispora thermophila DSM 19022]
MTQEYLARLYEYFKNIHQTPILENFLEIQLEELQVGKSIYKIKTSQKHSNIYGTVHGGTLASVCDTAMGTSCTTYGKRVVTIDMNISYIKSAPKESTLTAVGKVISNGRTIMRAVCEIFDEQGQLIVKSQASFYVTGEFSVSE